MLHMHITAWALTLLLFAITLILHFQGKPRNSRIAHMILRVLYVLTIGSGYGLVAKYGHAEPALIKTALGLGVIVFSDLALTLLRKGRNPGLLWLLFASDLAFTFYYGYIVISG